MAFHTATLYLENQRIDNIFRQACQVYCEHGGEIHRTQVLAWLTDPTFLNLATITAYTEAPGYHEDGLFQTIVVNALQHPEEDSEDSEAENVDGRMSIVSPRCGS